MTKLQVEFYLDLIFNNKTTRNITNSKTKIRLIGLHTMGHIGFLEMTVTPSNYWVRNRGIDLSIFRATMLIFPSREISGFVLVSFSM